MKNTIKKLYRVSVSIVEIKMHISSVAPKSWRFSMPMLFWLEQKNTSDQYKENISLDTTTTNTGITMCDSGLMIVALLTLLFSTIAFLSIFSSFDYNCNNFYYDDVVGLPDVITFTTFVFMT